jgi:hypothetical protein
MKRIIVIVIIGFVFATVQAQMDNPLKEGMPNTIKLTNGEVIYDLNGEWDSVYDSGGYGTYKDIVKITQEDKQFVGIYLLKGDNRVGKNEEKVKGKLKGNVFAEVLFHVVDPSTFEVFWDSVEGEISKDGNEIEIKRIYEYKGAKTIQTLSLKRK